MGRIGKFLTAEELGEPYIIDVDRKNALEVDGDFSWETAGKITEAKFTKGGIDAPKDRKGRDKKKSNASITAYNSGCRQRWCKRGRETIRIEESEVECS